MPVLTGVDILGIQSYVFGSNRLRDVLAASWMVEYVTQSEQLAQWPSLRPSTILLAAGGSSTLEFVSMDAARRWTAHYTRWLQDTAPGLDAVVVHRSFDGHCLAWALRALQVDIARAKLERCPSVPQLGLSVTASCSITGLPATGEDHGALVSPRIVQLRAVVEKARRRWGELLRSPEQEAGYELEFPAEIDLMGRTRGQASLVGVVHVDGNDVGKLIMRWLERCIEQNVNQEDVRKQYEEWSSAMTELGQVVMRALVARTAKCIRTKDDYHVLDGTPHDLGFRLHNPGNERTRRDVFLPLCPVLLGGDDLTFLCDGRIALDLAASALDEFARHAIPHLGPGGESMPLTACAGVALVKAHAPFHRSYELAEDLCRSAKRARRAANEKRSGTETGCWIDWYVGGTRPGQGVEAMRHRAYRHGGNHLTMRPYPLMGIENEDRSWGWLDRQLLGPGDTHGTANQGLRGAACWVGSRSRVKLLRALVTSGGAAIRRQVEAWRAIDTELRLPAALDDSGFVGAGTPLLDAIELLDLHLRLDPDPRVGGGPAEDARTDATDTARAVTR